MLLRGIQRLLGVVIKCEETECKMSAKKNDELYTMYAFICQRFDVVILFYKLNVASNVKDDAPKNVLQTL